MTTWLITRSLRFRLAVVGISAVLLVLGFLQLRSAPVDTLPEFTPPYVEVQTEALGLSAEEVEQLITVPLEADLLNGVKGVSTIRSDSVPGLSSITLVFEPGTDILTARQFTQEKLTEAVGALPNVSRPHELIQPRSSQSRVMMIGLDSSKLNEIQQGVLARWTIRPRLMGVPGVANVEIWGQRERQLQVLVDPKRLAKNNVSLLQVIKTTGNAQLVSPLSFLEGSTPGTGGFFETKNQRLGVRHVFPIAKPGDLARVKVEEASDLKLGDVAKVVEGHQPLIGDSVVDDHSGLMLVVEKLPGANTREVTEGVEKALDDLQPGLAGLNLDRGVFRPSDYVDDALGNVALALIVGVLLAALALGLFLFDWRATLVAIASALIALVTAGLILDVTDTTINALTFAGLLLAVVLIVHEAVLDLGARSRWTRDTADAGMLSTLVGARASIVYASLIAFLAILPVLLVEGVAGDIFRSFVGGYLLALATGLLAAATITPALGSLLYGRADQPRELQESSPLRWARARYDAGLARVSAAPTAMYVATGVIGVLAVISLFTFDQPSSPALLPNFKERQLLVHFNGRAGTSQPEMSRVTALATRELRSTPGVRNVAANVGRAVSGDVIGDVNDGEIWVTVSKDADYDETVKEVRNVMAGYPGMTSDVVTYTTDRARTVGAMEDGNDDDRNFKDDDVVKQVGGDFVVRVYGQDQETLRNQATAVQEMASRIEGVGRAAVAAQALEPNIQIEPKLAAAENVGIKPGDVRRAAAGLLSGITVGNLFENQKVFDVLVWGAPEVRRSVEDVQNLLIDVPGGGHVRLGDVADVSVKPTPADIKREAVARYADVSIDVSGKGRDDVINDVKEGLAKLSFPAEYHAEVIGEHAERSDAFKRNLAIAIGAAIGIFLLLQAFLGSWRLAAISFLVLPLALAGGVLALFIDGGVLSAGAVFGFLALIAVAAQNNASLVGRYGRMAEEGGDDPGLLARGAGESLAPVLAALLAGAALMLPFVFAGNEAGLEILHPMAVVVLGGLITSALITLFVVPVLYLRFGRKA
jgi:Cu/Ag efflux pump CusA